MKQKLAVTRALLARPALVFLDEPTAGFDPAAAVSFRDDIAEITQREGVTFFINTHNLAEAERLCARVGVINQGKLLAQGQPQELAERVAVARVEVKGRGFTDEILNRLRETDEISSADVAEGKLTIELRGGGSVAPLVRLLVEGGAEIEEVHKQRAKLEDFFMNVIKENS